ncbi:MAG: hypothetical protein DRJ60_00440 [Thermoprotei archaeon]|nr:MAG: hypothetical protein DRJ60_00440 [Thermoprotei archaeon]
MSDGKRAWSYEIERRIEEKAIEYTDRATEELAREILDKQSELKELENMLLKVAEKINAFNEHVRSLILTNAIILLTRNVITPIQNIIASLEIAKFDVMLSGERIEFLYKAMVSRYMRNLESLK